MIGLFVDLISALTYGSYTIFSRSERESWFLCVKGTEKVHGNANSNHLVVRHQCCVQFNLHKLFVTNSMFITTSGSIHMLLIYNKIIHSIYIIYLIIPAILQNWMGPWFHYVSFFSTQQNSTSLIKISLDFSMKNTVVYKETT